MLWLVVLSELYAFAVQPYQESQHCRLSVLPIPVPFLLACREQDQISNMKVCP